MEHGIPLNIHARPRIVGRRPDAIVNIETDVFQEKSYKQYSSQHLRDALIAVKKGYSVYAASNKYGVPRKTLRNWMEKYDIKSAGFAMSNVQCLYDSASGSETDPSSSPRGLTMTSEARDLADDHTYGARCFEPPAFLIRQNNTSSLQPQPLSHLCDFRPRIMTIGPGLPSSDLIHVSDQLPPAAAMSHQPESSMNKRVRRSEAVLRAAADCVSRGLTFQRASERFNIPISTIRFFMARKGILPRRRRGRTTLSAPPPPPPSASSPELPPLHIRMQHFKLPAAAALRDEDDDRRDHDETTTQTTQ